MSDTGEHKKYTWETTKTFNLYIFYYLNFYRRAGRGPGNARRRRIRDTPISSSSKALVRKLRLEICHQILTAKLRSVITLQFVITFIIINNKILIAFSFFKDFAANSGYGRFLKKFSIRKNDLLEIKVSLSAWNQKLNF